LCCLTPLSTILPLYIVSLVDETGVPGENHRRATSHWQILSHNVVSSTWVGLQFTTLVVIGTDCIMDNLETQATERKRYITKKRLAIQTQATERKRYITKKRLAIQTPRTNPPTLRVNPGARKGFSRSCFL
jgi:hypothetical protein